MEKYIKTRDSVKDVKSIDKASSLKDKMKVAVIKVKDEFSDTAVNDDSRGERDPSGYAENQTERSMETGAYATERGVRSLIGKRMKKEDVPNSGASNIKTREQIRRAQTKSRAEKARKNASGFTAPKQRESEMVKGKTYTIKTGVRYARVSAAGKRKAAVAAGGAKLMKAEAARQAARLAAAKKAVKAIKLSAATIQKIVRAIIAAFRALITAIASAGSVVVLIVIIVILIAVILASAIGIFFSNDGGGITAREAMTTLTTEFADEMRAVENANPHDELVVTYTGGASMIDWKSVLAIYAVKLTEAEDGALDVVSFDDEKIEKLREILFDMNVITYETVTEERSRTVEVTDDKGETTTETETWTVIILKITVTQMTVEEAAKFYNFSASQNVSLAEILKPEYDDLWAELLGGFTGLSGMGTPSLDRIPLGFFTWPLPVPGIITSYYGWREDPFTGVLKYHDGTDLAAPEGTPILAAAGGTVTVANGTDSWGGGYGYYVMINHGNGYETVYGHCSSIAVQSGTPVSQGQIIGYVGSTGRSTGPHLHWEVYEFGSRTDALKFFA